MTLVPLPALRDNYIWLLADESTKHCIIIDPTLAEGVVHYINQQNWQPQAILITHHHADHLAGVAAIEQHYPQISVYGPSEIQAAMQQQQVNFVNISQTTQLLLLNQSFTIINTPGHTLGHVCYYSEPYLFCGDTLFSAGCGRLFEGSAQQMVNSLDQLTQLPKTTQICCAHEYTLNNLQFARTLMPNNVILRNYWQKVTQLRQNNQPTLPSNLALELAINPFLRLFDVELQKHLAIDQQKSVDWQLFAQLRRLKDNF